MGFFYPTVRSILFRQYLESSARVTTGYRNNPLPQNDENPACDWIHAFVWLILALLSLWAIAALYVDFRITALRIPITVAYVAVVADSSLPSKTTRFGGHVVLACSGIVLARCAQLEAFQRSRLAS